MFEQARAAGNEIGPDEEGNVGDFIMEIFLDLAPGLRDRVGAFLRRDDVAGDDFYDPSQVSYAAPHFARILPEADEKERLLADLGTPRLHPIHARALLDAAHDEGLDLPDADILALFAPGRPAGEALRAALGGFELDVDTASLRQLARGAIRSGRAAIE